MGKKFKRLRSNPAILGWIALLLFIYKLLAEIDTFKSVVQDMSSVWNFLSTPWGMLTLLVIGLGFIFYSVLKKPKNSDLPVVLPQEVAPKRTSDWLLQVLAFNQENIYTAVKGHIVQWRFYEINKLEPHFEFAAELINTSIFTLHFLGVSGFIKIDRNECQMPPKASERWSIMQGETFTVIIKQPVSPDMQKRIKEANTKKEQMMFELGNLELNMETTTEGFKGLKPRITFVSQAMVPEPM